MLARAAFFLCAAIGAAQAARDAFVDHLHAEAGNLRQDAIRNPEDARAETAAARLLEALADRMGG